MREGKHPRLYEKLGAHPATVNGVAGTQFAVWAPHAESLSVIGDFNEWTPGKHPLALVGTVDGGVWQGFVPGVRRGALYKYHVRSRVRGFEVAKADPFALRHEVAPGTASIVWTLEGYQWNDGAWMSNRAQVSTRAAPITIYEVHLGSWMRVPEDNNRSLTYREIAPKLVDYVKQLGFTHVELMPLTEHPFFGSWGYETTGYFAATSRYGTPEDLMALVDALHAAGIGVLLDWVPAHFPTDEHGLVYFDGTPLYEHPDSRLGFHPEWNTSIFDFGRQEVRSFLLSSALFWLERFHLDGLRVDGVASMIYRDYGRKSGEWIPNAEGGNQYWEAVELLQRLNEAIAREQPDTITVAEESTAWPQVTGPTRSEPADAGERGPTADRGLGFHFKWDMGWMHDTLKYFNRDPIHRRHHHHELTMRGLYAFSERFVLPLSHDEVVHGKGSLLAKMPGDRWQKFASLRLLYAYMYSQPGKKLLFMGSELAQWREWNHDGSLDWHLLDDAPHRQIHLLVGTLNHLYRSTPALHELDTEPAGFEWLDADDAENSVLVYERIARNGERVLCVLNFTPMPRANYRVGVTAPGLYREILNTDAAELGGSGQGNLGGVQTTPVRAHRRELSLNLTLPPLGALFLKL
ncbi:MAG: 1,4-alpha-glucan branching protein GlgB [Deltaproteobacteria bacterium]|nr:1,4-alpha-glucan branching protein GlgB [Deltaproteobacteria bacterium]MDQ3296091.1 1,4-alpha-glucan branching protein GlgB [Myxococcota bacterium]